MCKIVLKNADGYVIIRVGKMAVYYQCIITYREIPVRFEKILITLDSKG